ncbi:MAG: Xaa-Pro peptidase family protein [Pseudomonadota bacterium]
MACAVFPPEEFEARVSQTQGRMARVGIEALLLTTDADIRYFTGFLTRFWESPTRPWFLVLPAEGKPIAVIPSIGAPLMRRTWLDDIRTWRAPNYDDDGVSLLVDTLGSVTSKDGMIGLPGGNGTHLRMPVQDWARVRALLPGRRFGDDKGLMAAQRMVKSEAEVRAIAKTCAIANRAFDRVPEVATAGVPLSEVFRRFQILCLEEGADWVPYLAGGAGQGGYRDVISPADDRPLAVGDVLMLDTGLICDGYFCDFDRNFSVGPASNKVKSGHARLIEATQAAYQAARPGQTAADLFNVMDDILTVGQGGSDAGRLGHGVGLQLTEPPSLIAEDHTVLAPGMVLTLEPGIDMDDGQIMVHEENIVIRDAGAEWLSAPSGAWIRTLTA